MRRTARAARGRAPDLVKDVLRAAGRPLDGALRADAASRLGHDFRDVRIHADGDAAASAEAIGAAAYAYGRHVVFGESRFAPGTIDGRRLLLHELTHVVQQRGGPAPIDGPIPLGARDAPHEREADAATPRLSAPPRLQLQPAPIDIRAAIPGLRAAATPAALYTAFNATLGQVRAAIVAGQTIAEADARAVAEAAGERLWQIATTVREFGDVTHFRPLMDIQALIGAAGTEPIFTTILDAFTWAARGATTINFRAPSRAGARVVRVLVTGFDPWHSSGTVPPGGINPSGAVALELDGEEINAGRNVVAVVESVVLPVDFGQFATGRVEEIFRLALARGAQAILTVSLDPNIAVGSRVRLEQFVVGVHEGGPPAFEAIPPEPGTPDTEQRILETPVNVEGVAADAGRLRAVVRTPVQLRFASAADASAVARASRGTLSGLTVTISRVSALHDIISTMHRTSPTQISFELGGHSYTATVVEGPGGSFLSNEVSFRALRLLGGLGQRGTVPSFHTHIPRVSAGLIPQGAATGADRRTVRRARRRLGRIVETMRRIIRSVARRVDGGTAFTARPSPPP
jgi:hypothetical protein